MANDPGEVCHGNTLGRSFVSVIGEIHDDQALVDNHWFCLLRRHLGLKTGSLLLQFSSRLCHGELSL